MKKALIIVLLLAILAVVGVMAWRYYSRSIVMEDILPAGPVFYVKSIDLAKQLDELTATKAWAYIKGAKIHNVLAKTGASRSDLAAYDGIEAQLKSKVFQQVVKLGAGKEIALVIYPVGGKMSSPKDLETMGENIFVVVRFSTLAQMGEFFAQFYRVIGQDITSKVVKYKENEIWRLQYGTNVIGTARFNDVVVLGFGDTAAKACIDVATRAKPPLSKDPRFLSAKADFLPGANVHGYADWEALLKQFKGMALQMVRQKGRKTDLFERKFNEALAFQTIGFSSVVGKVTRFKADVYYEKGRMSMDALKTFSCQPQENASINMIPEGILGYQWSPCYDFKNYWTGVKKEIKEVVSSSGQTLSTDQMIADTEKALNLSIEKDILPALGNEFGGALFDLKMGASLPQPQLALFIKINDQAKAQKTVDALLAQQQVIKQQEERHQGELIKVMTVPAFSEFRPGYVFLGSYLFVATDWDKLKTVIDTSKGARSALGSVSLPQGEDVKLSGIGNSVFFLQLGPLAKKVSEFLEQLNHWVKTQEVKREAFRSGLLGKAVDIKKSAEEIRASLIKLEAEKQQLGLVIKEAIPMDPAVKSAVQAQEAELQTQIKEKQLAIETAKAAGTDVSAIQAEETFLQQKMGDTQKRLKTIEQQEMSSAKLNSRMADLEKQIMAQEKDQTALLTQQQELDQTLGKMERADVMPADVRNTLFDDLLKPVLRGLSSCPVFAAKRVFRPDAFEVFTYLKIE